MTKLPQLYSHYDKPMWESASQGTLKLQRCQRCASFRYPPGPACPECLCLGYEWAPVSGKASLLSWTVFHRQYLPAYPPPTLVIAAQLEEGPIMITFMDHKSLPELKLGRPLRLTYGNHPDGYRIPYFTTADIR